MKSAVPELMSDKEVKERLDKVVRVLSDCNPVFKREELVGWIGTEADRQVSYHSLRLILGWSAKGMSKFFSHHLTQDEIKHFLIVKDAFFHQGLDLLLGMVRLSDSKDFFTMIFTVFDQYEHNTPSVSKSSYQERLTKSVMNLIYTHSKITSSENNEGVLARLRRYSELITKSASFKTRLSWRDSVDFFPGELTQEVPEKMVSMIKSIGETDGNKNYQNYLSDSELIHIKQNTKTRHTDDFSKINMKAEEFKVYALNFVAADYAKPFDAIQKEYVVDIDKVNVDDGKNTEQTLRDSLRELWKKNYGPHGPDKSDDDDW